MIIDGFQKLTLLDFPGAMACILFTKGCNLKCPFCHNGPLVLNKDKMGLISEEEIFEYLKKRKKILDGVVISGGEPLLQKDIKRFIIDIKKLGYKIKLDTNGTSPKLLKELIDESLIDYVAMDIKNVFEKYPKITGCKNVNVDNIKRSIEVLKEEKVDYEFRTTIVKEFHEVNDIKKILTYIGSSKYFIQNFVDNENVIKSGLHGFTKEELININEELKDEFTNFKIREL